MKNDTSYTAVVWQEGELYVAQCLGIDVASQGHSRSEAMTNLQEALELYFEDTDSRKTKIDISMPQIEHFRLSGYA